MPPAGTGSNGAQHCPNYSVAIKAGGEARSWSTTRSRVSEPPCGKGRPRRYAIIPKANRAQTASPGLCRHPTAFVMAVQPRYVGVNVWATCGRLSTAKSTAPCSCRFGSTASLQKVGSLQGEKQPSSAVTSAVPVAVSQRHRKEAIDRLPHLRSVHLRKCCIVSIKVTNALDSNRFVSAHLLLGDVRAWHRFSCQQHT